MIKVGDKVRWQPPGDPETYLPVSAEVLTVRTHDCVVAGPGPMSTLHLAALSELTLVESAPEPFRDLVDLSVVDPTPKRDAFTHALGAWKCPECDSIQAENARLREALQMAVDTIAHNGPDGVSMAAALGIRPSIRHKETP